MPMRAIDTNVLVWKLALGRPWGTNTHCALPLGVQGCPAEKPMIKTFIIQAIAAGAAVLIGAKFIPGVRIRSSQTTIGVALLFALLNLVLGWLLKLLFAVLLLPAAIVTFGLPYLLLGLFVNTLLLW